MTDENMVAPVCHKSESGLSPTWIYVLYLIALFTALPVLVGVIVAYVSRSDAEEPEESHYQYLIRTFWIGLAYLIVGGLLMPVGIGFLICAFAWVFVLVRSMKGLGWYNNCEPVPNPKTWLW